MAIAIIPVLFGCGSSFLNNDDQKYLEQNINEINDYAAQRNIVLQRDANYDVFYTKDVENPSGKAPGVGDIIYASYTLMTFDGDTISNTTAADSSFISYGDLSGVITGFYVAITSLKEGEKSTFYLPSTLAFGGNPPAGSKVDAWEPLILVMESVRVLSETQYIDLYTTKKGFSGVEVTASGLRFIKTLDKPAADTLKNGDNVSVKYKGYFLNGSSFDSGTFSVVLGTNKVIKGFEEGIGKLRVGEKATIIMPSSIGYGAAGSGKIGPYTPIAFDIEILSK